MTCQECNVQLPLLQHTPTRCSFIYWWHFLFIVSSECQEIHSSYIALPWGLTSLMLHIYILQKSHLFCSNMCRYSGSPNQHALDGLPFVFVHIGTIVIRYMHHTQELFVLFIQLKPDDVEYVNHGITTAKLLRRAVLNMGYPPAISCVFVYRVELRKTGRPVLVSLDVTGAGKELAFMCKTYEEADDQQRDRSRNGELECCCEKVAN